MVNPEEKPTETKQSTDYEWIIENGVRVKYFGGKGRRCGCGCLCPCLCACCRGGCCANKKHLKKDMYR